MSLFFILLSCQSSNRKDTDAYNLVKELRKDNISVTAICPGGLNTTTRLCYQNRILGMISRESVLNPEDAAKIAIDGEAL